MNKFFLSVSCQLIVLAVLSAPGLAWGQAAKGAGGGAHRIALLDMGQVFKEYPKFERLREDLKKKIVEKETEAKGAVTKIQSVQAVLKSGTLKVGSPEYTDKERELTHLTADFEAQRKQTQMELAREEAAIYHTINLEVNDMVRRVAEYKGYTLVLRFNREDLNSNDPQKVAQGLSRQVLYYQTEDDITNFVVHNLKVQDQKLTKGRAKPAEEIHQTSGTR